METIIFITTHAIMCASGLVVLVPRKIFRFKTRVDNTIEQDGPHSKAKRDEEISKQVEPTRSLLTDKLIFEQ